MIDSHIHVMPQYRTDGLVRWIRKAFPEHPSREGIGPDEIIAQLRENGMEAAFNFVFPLKEEETGPLNEFSRRLADRYPFLVPFGSMHADTADKAGAAELCVTELGLAGIKIHPYAQRFEVFRDDFEPMFEVLERHGRPFVVHTGFDAFYNRTQDLSGLERILDAHPGMPVILVHALFPRFALAYRLMSRHPLLYLDMTNVPGTIVLYDRFAREGWTAPDELSTEDRDHLDGLLREFGARIMFGTDHPVGMGSPARIYADLEALEPGPTAWRDLTFNAALAFLERHCGEAGARVKSSIAPGRAPE